jgi:hypothetical protein
MLNQALLGNKMSSGLRELIMNMLFVAITKLGECLESFKIAMLAKHLSNQLRGFG